MHSIHSLVRTIMALAIGMSGSSVVFSAPAEGQHEAEGIVIDVPMGHTEKAVISSLGLPLAPGQLAQFRGGFDLVRNDMQLNGTVADNAASHIISGSNSITEGAFNNASGFPTVIQNSGSNVLIQNATIVNLQLQ